MAYEMYAITAAVLGGCSLRGGEGSLVGVIIGAAILRVIRSAVIFLNISTHWTYCITGLVLLSAVTVDALLRRHRSTTAFVERTERQDTTLNSLRSKIQIQ
jgi:ribose transport system permease protein